MGLKKMLEFTALAVIVGVGVTACMSPQPAASHVVLVPVEKTQARLVEPKDAAPVAALLRTIGRFTRLSNSRQRHALHEAQAQYDRDRTVENRLRLGLMHALDGRTNDIDRALNLLRGQAWVKDHYEYRMLARLVITCLEKQRSLEDKVGAVQRALAVVGDQRNELKKKLNALKAIEKIINDRDNSKTQP